MAWIHVHFSELYPKKRRDLKCDICKERDRFLIGRYDVPGMEGSNDLWIPDYHPKSKNPVTSRFHATIIEQKEGGNLEYVLLDHSRNGTFELRESHGATHTQRLPDCRNSVALTNFRNSMELDIKSMKLVEKVFKKEIEQIAHESMSLQSLMGYEPGKFTKPEDFAYVITMLKDQGLRNMMAGVGWKLHHGANIGIPTYEGILKITFYEGNK